MSSPLSSPGVAATRWRILEAYCQQHGLKRPSCQIVSDRRGGRTAWSVTIDVGGFVSAAKYWYDGNYLESAKEDAAEVTLDNLRSGKNKVLPK